MQKIRDFPRPINTRCEDPCQELSGAESADSGGRDLGTFTSYYNLNEMRTHSASLLCNHPHSAQHSAPARDRYKSFSLFVMLLSGPIKLSSWKISVQ